MLFMTKWTTHPEYRHSNLQAFAKLPSGDEVGDGGEGLTLIGRWHGLNGTTGVAIFESEDPAAVARWSLAWGTTMDIEITPVADDDAIKAIGASLRS